MRRVLSTFCMGLSIEHIVLRVQRACVGERQSNSSRKSSLSRYARTVRRLSFRNSASLGSCFSVRFPGRLSRRQREFFSTGSRPLRLSSFASAARTASMALPGFCMMCNRSRTWRAPLARSATTRR